MNVISILRSVKQIFPAPLNNEMINSMFRRELTPEEAS
jgi:hypothetical protein